MKTDRNAMDIQEQSWELFGACLREREGEEYIRLSSIALSPEDEQHMKEYFQSNESAHYRSITHLTSRTGIIQRPQPAGRKSIYLAAARIAAIAIVCIALAGGVAIALSSSIRIQLMKLLSEITPEYTKIEVVEDDSVKVPSDWKGSYFPTVLPSNSALEDYTSNSMYSRAYFSSNYLDGTWDLYFAEYNSSMSVQIDTEGATQIKRKVGLYDATVFEKEGLISIYWTDGVRLLLIQTHHSDIEESISYASGVALIK